MIQLLFDLHFSLFRMYSRISNTRTHTRICAGFLSSYEINLWTEYSICTLSNYGYILFLYILFYSVTCKQCKFNGLHVGQATIVVNTPTLVTNCHIWPMPSRHKATVHWALGTWAGKVIKSTFWTVKWPSI